MVLGDLFSRGIFNTEAINMSLVLAAADEFIRLANSRGQLLTKMQLQKLLYYAQAWSLVLRRSEVIDDDFQAWKDGPVNPAAWSHFRHVAGRYIPPTDGDHLWLLSPDARRFLAAVWQSYGDKDGHELSELTHREKPWLAARGETPPTDSSTAVIETAAMTEFYADHPRPEPLRQYEEMIRREEDESTAKLDARRAASGGKLIIRRTQPAGA